ASAQLSEAVKLVISAPATTETYTLSLHDALPISGPEVGCGSAVPGRSALGHVDRLTRVAVVERRGEQIGKLPGRAREHGRTDLLDRKSTRLNSSHVKISYAVFCLKTKRS